MSRRLAAVLLAALLTACGAANAGIAPRSGAPPAPIETAEVEAAAAAQPAAPEPTATVEPVVLPTPRPLQQTAEPTPEGPWLTGEVRVFPGPRHFVGDLITVEAAVVNADQLDRPPQAVLSVDGSRLDAEPFIALSPLRDHAIVFRWAWDTTDVAPGQHTLTLALEREEGEPQTLSAFVALEAADARPPHEETARWAQRVNACCRISYITSTAAGRDIDELDIAIDQAFSQVEATFGMLAANKPVPITLLDNVWGNGAYVSGDVVITYVDRAYTNLNLETTLRHEAAHWTLRSIGTGATPTLLSEGAAVYAAGGHFQPQPLAQRAAALLDSGLYVPLVDLANDFRGYQHETAYLEAAALVSYLVDTYGMADFLALYGAEGIQAGSTAAWLDVALRRVYGVNLNQVERDFRDWLGEQVPGAQATDLELTIRLYNTIRRYQSLHAAYQEVIPSSQEGIAAAQVSEYMREPATLYNVVLETAFVSAHSALQEGRYEEAEALIDALEATLEDGDFTREPLGTFVQIAARLGQIGYEAQRITLTGENAATVEAIQTWPQVRTLNVTHDGEAWQLVEGN